MNSRERVETAMRLGTPDRVPLMCQLAIGHYFLQSGIDPVEIWHSTEGFGQALIALQRRYGFDGILINLSGRNPDWRSYVRKIENRDGEQVITWKNGWTTVVPPDDLPHVYREDGERYFPQFFEIEPEQLFYVDPHDISGLTYPSCFGFSTEAAVPGPDFFPPWHYDTLKHVVEQTKGEVSVHAEIFSPFSQFMELLDYTSGLMALIDDPAKVKACLDRLAEGTIELGCGYARHGAHAILISSAFAGAGFISRQHYTEYVLPYERKVIDGIKSHHDIPIYTHTCGAIGDRLDLMEQTGTNGIDTLDPSPLGNVDISTAKREIGGRMFIKGNIDAVNTLLLGTPDEAVAAARERITAAAPGGGYILSTACSVAPAVPPENIHALLEAVERYGVYPVLSQEQH